MKRILMVAGFLCFAGPANAWWWSSGTYEECVAEKLKAFPHAPEFSPQVSAVRGACRKDYPCPDGMVEGFFSRECVNKN
jgi:hypothetical protein